jgi:hypothetical protein
MGMQPWSTDPRGGNPAISASVEKYLTLVEEEQAEAGVMVQKPVIFLPSKMRTLSTHLAFEARNPDNAAPVRAQLAQDRAWYLVGHKIISRGTQVGDTRANNIAYATPARRSLFFGFTWGKCLRDGSPHLCRIDAQPLEPFLCGLAAVQEYVACVRALGWNMREGYFFSRIEPLTGARLPGPQQPAATAKRFVSYLKKLGIHEGETLRGLRGGGAVTALAKGSAVPMAEVQQRAGWSHKAGTTMIQHYTDADRFSEYAGLPFAELTTDAYAQLNATPLLQGEAREQLLV